MNAEQERKEIPSLCEIGPTCPVVDKSFGIVGIRTPKSHEAEI